MSAFRGRGHEANWIAVTLNPFALPALSRHQARTRTGTSRRRYKRATRLMLLLGGIALSWALFGGLAFMLYTIRVP